MQKLFSFMRSYALIVLVPLPVVFCLRSRFLCQCGHGCFSTFFFSQIQCTGFLVRSLMNLELKFVQGDKYGSTCIFLHSPILFDQDHLLKMLSFPHVYF